MAIRAYTLGWLLLIVAFVERALLTTDTVRRVAVNHDILPHHFMELSLLFFVIAIASERCYGNSRA